MATDKAGAPEGSQQAVLICPEYGAAEFVRDTRHKTYLYKGKEITIPAVTGDHCPACSGVVLDRVEGDRLAKLIRECLRRCNAEYFPTFDAANYLQDEEQIQLHLAKAARCKDPNCWPAPSQM